MRIKITRSGIFGAEGEIPVGTELDVKSELTGWAGRYEVISGDGNKGKTAVTNPKKPEGYAVADKGNGWFVITKDGEEITKSLREDDVKGFDGMSDEDKAAYVATLGQ